jgi:TPP-dependent pyruvate/acetoin dehydrogenase alpha subunit
VSDTTFAKIHENGSQLSEDFLLDLFRKMVTIRLFNERQAEETMRGNLFGYVHLYSGQEAVGVGSIAALKAGDKITSTHRAEGHFISLGAPMDKLMAETFGKRTGFNGGKGGPMGVAAFDHGIISAVEIVGAGIPVATGAAWGYKLRGGDQVVLCFFGDGAANQGMLYECLNMAALWKLPVIYLCENNGFAVDTSIERAFAQPEIAQKAPPFGVPGVVVDGTDVIAVYEATREAVERARAGDGPTLIEAKARRWVGHHQADAQWYYRTREDVDENKKHCPIEAMRADLMKQGILTEEIEAAMTTEILDEIDRAVEFAETSEWPTDEDIYTNLYANEAGE